MMEERQTFGQLIAGIRATKGKSMRDAAKDIGIGHGHLCDLENDKQDNPSAKTLVKIAKYYGLEVGPVLSMFQISE